jgi:hypothetical protein
VPGGVDPRGGSGLAPARVPGVGPIRLLSLRFLGIGVPSPCMHAALLGPCFKTGPSPSLTPGGRVGASARQCCSRRARGHLPSRGGAQAPGRGTGAHRPSHALLRGVGPLGCPPRGADRLASDYAGVGCAVRFAGPGDGRPRITREGRGTGARGGGRPPSGVSRSNPRWYPSRDTPSQPPSYGDGFTY